MLGVLTQLNKDKTAFQRIFVQDVRKCEDMLRIIRYLRSLYTKVSSLFYLFIYCAPRYLRFSIYLSVYLSLSLYIYIISIVLIYLSSATSGICAPSRPRPVRLHGFVSCACVPGVCVCVLVCACAFCILLSPCHMYIYT
jgi:hypothetical protein